MPINNKTISSKAAGSMSEKSGIPISRFDNLDKAALRRKIQLAAMEIAKKK